MDLVKENVIRVREEIAGACEAVGRSADDVLLVAVTKTRSADEVRQAVEAGVTDIGENYLQEAQEKHRELRDLDARWHMIGSLQSNKVKPAVGLFDMIQSVGSVKRASEIAKRALEAQKTVDVLLEVNISGEDAKHGATCEDALHIASEIGELESVRLRGMMGMAPFLSRAEDTRPYFAKLYKLWDKLPDEQRVWLSMGMTGDFVPAIAEGSNMVRIGTAIFGSREQRTP